jgi:hypothetical protein
MKLKLTTMLPILSAAFISVQATATEVTGTLLDVWFDMPGSSITDARQEAAEQASETKPLKYKSIAVETKVFEGTVTPSRRRVLAIFSDDGCRVAIRAEGMADYVFNRFKKGQHLPNMSQSFHVLAVTLEEGVTYEITVEYSNILYRGTTDIDGCTLFAFDPSLEFISPDRVVIDNALLLNIQTIYDAYYGTDISIIPNCAQFRIRAYGVDGSGTQIYVTADKSEDSVECELDAVPGHLGNLETRQLVVTYTGSPLDWLEWETQVVPWFRAYGIELLDPPDDDIPRGVVFAQQLGGGAQGQLPVGAKVVNVEVRYMHRGNPPPQGIEPFQPLYPYILANQTLQLPNIYQAIKDFFAAPQGTAREAAIGEIDTTDLVPLPYKAEFAPPPPLFQQAGDLKKIALTNFKNKGKPRWIFLLGGSKEKNTLQTLGMSELAQAGHAPVPQAKWAVSPPCSSPLILAIEQFVAGQGQQFTGFGVAGDDLNNDQNKQRGFWCFFVTLHELSWHLIGNGAASQPDAEALGNAKSREGVLVDVMVNGRRADLFRYDKLTTAYLNNKLGFSKKIPTSPVPLERADGNLDWLRKNQMYRFPTK